ncbi:HNH endonuclease [Fertoebacter nigrum]|uniref:Putative HNH nuclease YajD n=1 Tax=Fertoeibacter niger TaxID=2656921 RepID=A0A8X8GVW7_9RHOB|nr:HNH endonuclease [Fertoeibacter niger]NUB42868.1 HNH endonuclease [Fertoeibacter niger]
MKDHFRHSKRITSTKRWQAVRHAVLERDGWACVQCGALRRLEVDHIKPVRARPDLSFNPANCQTLCRVCHTKKTRLEIGHKPLSQDRQAWRDAVSELTGRDDRGIMQKEINDA